MSLRLDRILLCALIAASGGLAQNALWSDGTAKTIPADRFEMGFLHTPARYGVTDELELSSYLLWDALIPGIYVKRRWTDIEGCAVATTHGMSSPTPMLRFLAREGPGFLLPPDNYVPTFLIVESHLLISRRLAGEQVATLSVGGKCAFTIGDRSQEYPTYQRVQTMDYPFVFTRTAFLTKTPNFLPIVSIGLDSPLVWRFVYAVDCSYYVLTLRDNLREEEMTCWALESTCHVTWHVSGSFAFQIGAAYSTGSYPFGHNWVVYPTMDITIGFGGEK